MCSNHSEISEKSTQSNREKEMDFAFLNRSNLDNSFYIFPESAEETKLRKARAMLGEIVQKVPDEELAVYITQFQYLLDSWLDEYEMNIFNDKTLRQMLGEGR